MRQQRTSGQKLHTSSKLHNMQEEKCKRHRTCDDQQQVPRIPESSERNTTEMKILQLNLNHCESAQDLLTQSIREHKIDVAVLSEPYKHLEGNGWASDITGKSSIWNCGTNSSRLMSVKAARGFVRARIGETYVYSCYLPPSLTLTEATSILENLAQDIKDHRPVVVAGDFNAWAVNWGCPRTSQRGQALLETFAMLDIVLMNTGNQQTFQKAGTGSIIDLTFMSPNLARSTKWFVSQHYTRSDHLAIICEIKKHDESKVPYTYDARYRVDSMEAEVIEVMLADVTLTGDATEKATQTMKHLTKACDAAMSKTRPNRHNSEPVYWWTAEIAELRSECNRARRVYQRSRGTHSFQGNQLQYKQKRKALKKAIKGSKRQCFLQLCDEVDSNPWGLGYRLVMKKLKVFKPLPTTCPATLRNVVETLFPAQDALRAYDLEKCCEGDQNMQLTDKDELLMITKRIKNNKAPGPDGVPNEALKVAIRSHTDIFVDLYNTCLKEGTFPTQWKLQKLVLIPKGSKPAEDPTGYRPLCMLDTAGKILERLIANRLEAAIDDAGGLSSSQFGFRKARSTTDAVVAVKSIAQKAIEGTRWLYGSKEYCLMATLDVKNAFNTANWNQILMALDCFQVPTYIRKIILSYFTDRTLRYNTDAGVREYKITGGVPQGSVLGPLLWNIMYDGVLRLSLPPGSKIIGFADDIAVVVVAKVLQQAEATCNQAVGVVKEWLRKNGLTLADHKTEAVLISSRKKVESANIMVGENTIGSKPFIKYLGVLIDHRLNFRDHLSYASSKAAEAVTALTRIMMNTRGPRQNRRRLLNTVVSSILLYAAPAWAEATNCSSYVSCMKSVYRLSALRVCCAFRTVSEDTIMVIAGLLPINLMAKEYAEVYQNKATSERQTIRKEARERSLRSWQGSWSSSLNGRWTYRLIPLIAKWVNRKHGQLDYYLTQILTGHGCFKSYLYRFKHEDDPYCSHCAPAVEDAEHVFFVCPRFVFEREELSTRVGKPISADNLVDIMLEAEEHWSAVCNMAKIVISKLRRAEQQRRSS